MIVVDSSVWIANLRNTGTVAVQTLADIRPRSAILVGDLILLELLQGARDTGQARRIEAAMGRFTTTEMMSRDRAVSAAGNYRKLRELGITVRKTMDLLIATFCIEEGHVLLHDDRDFLPFQQHLGLRCL